MSRKRIQRRTGGVALRGGAEEEVFDAPLAKGRQAKKQAPRIPLAPKVPSSSNTTTNKKRTNVPTPKRPTSSGTRKANSTSKKADEEKLLGVKGPSISKETLKSNAKKGPSAMEAALAASKSKPNNTKQTLTDDKNAPIFQQITKGPQGGTQLSGVANTANISGPSLAERNAVARLSAPPPTSQKTIDELAAEARSLFNITEDTPALTVETIDYGNLPEGASVEAVKANPQTYVNQFNRVRDGSAFEQNDTAPQAPTVNPTEPLPQQWNVDGGARSANVGGPSVRNTSQTNNTNGEEPMAGDQRVVEYEDDDRINPLGRQGLSNNGRSNVPVDGGARGTGTGGPASGGTYGNNGNNTPPPPSESQAPETTASGTVVTRDAEGAPISIEQTVDRPEARTITATDVEAGKDSEVIQMDEAVTAEGGASQAALTTAQTAGEAAQAQTPEEVKASTMETFKAAGIDPMVAETGTISPEAIASLDEKQLTVLAEAAARDPDMEEAAMAVAAQRPEMKEYMTAVEDGVAEQVDADSVEGPAVTTREAQQISDDEITAITDNITGAGIDVENLPAFEKAATRTAQVGEAKTAIAQELGEAPAVDLEGREAILGEAPVGTAAEIGGIPTMEAAQMQAVTGEARKAAASDMLEVVGDMPPEVTAAIVEDPSVVVAQLDTAPVEVVAATAALPQEALVSVQMEGLLAGMEGGEIPAWAKPAYDAINQQMAARGLTASTVGQSAMFNAIIQSALPIANANAQALQQRANQNLTNQQQANIQKSSLIMEQRLSNLANKQTSASQTADMAQQTKLKQADLTQQATIVTSTQQQETRTQNIANAQQRASQESAQRQQVALANLDAASRMDLANLQALNDAGAQNLNAEQQTRLTEYNAKIDKVMRQAELKQDMEKANLSTALQMEMANLTELNAAARDTMTAEQTEKLTNLQTLVDFKKTNADLAQQMELANLSNEQQMELANLQERAATDAANFTADNQMRMQEILTTVDVMSKNADLQQQAEMAKMNAEERIALANLTAKNQADSENMSAENVAELQQYEKRMEVAQVNAQLAQQMGIANLSNKQEAAMFNAQMDANLDMKQFDADQQTALANSQFMQTMAMKDLDNQQSAILQNATAQANLDMANLSAQERLAAQNAQAFLQMDMANLENKQQASVLNQQQQQQTMLSNQAAENAARQFNAANQQQADQFMASLSTQVDQFNSQQQNAMAQFNTAEKNRAEAQNAQNMTQVAMANAQIETSINQFNAQQEQARNQWNASNQQAIEQADIAWRRQVNTVNTAAQNAANQQNVMNAYNLDLVEMQNASQQLRDEAAYIRQSYENEESRKTQLYATAIGNEAAAGKKSNSSSAAIANLIDGILG